MDPACCDSVAPAGLTVQVCFPGARAAVLDNLNRQREEGRLCDLSIQVQGRVFRAHRCVLAASSPYFHDQVLLKNVTTVSLPSVMDPVAFDSVLSSAYTGQLSIVHDDIVNYVTVASFLQMWHIVDKCTEILKRPRSSGDAAATEAAAAPGSGSRQQSPSSTDCLYGEREGRRRERRPDALPPLATWRRPQHPPRWARPRPQPGQHPPDSQLDAVPGYLDGDYGGAEDALVSSGARGGPAAQEGPGRHHGGGVPAGEKQKVRFQPRGGDRGLDKTRETDETQDRRRSERREIEADEGVGDGAERKETFVPTGSCEFRPVPGEPAAGGGGGAPEKPSGEETKEKVQRDVGGDPSSGLPGLQGCGSGVPGPSGPPPARLQWQAGPWSQPEQRPPDGEDEDDEDDVDLDCFTSGGYSRDTYDEIEDGTGQVSQRPLGSPDLLGGSDGSWQGCSLTPTSSRQPSAPFQPPLSPPTPSSSSSSVSAAGAPYAGKVHFCHCGKAYTLKSMRDRHVKMQHLNLRPFGCPVCTKSFKMKHHLTKHLKTHGGLRPYECGLCGKKVIWRDSFLRHQARCEGLASSSSAASGGAGAAAASAPADVDDAYGYGFDEGEAFLPPPPGQVKVEEVDFHREMEDGMGGLLGGVSGIVEQLSGPAQHLDAVGHVFKEEATESFSGS